MEFRMLRLDLLRHIHRLGHGHAGHDHVTVKRIVEQELIQRIRGVIQGIRFVRGLIRMRVPVRTEGRGIVVVGERSVGDDRIVRTVAGLALDHRLFRGLGSILGLGLCLGLGLGFGLRLRLGSFGGSGLLRAARDHTEDHDQCQQDRYNLFHHVSSCLYFSPIEKLSSYHSVGTATLHPIASSPRQKRKEAKI